MAYELEIHAEKNPAVTRFDHMAGIACEMNNRRSQDDLKWIFDNQTRDGHIKIRGNSFAHLEKNDQGKNEVVFSSPFNEIYTCKNK